MTSAKKPPRTVWILIDVVSGYSEIHRSRAEAEKWKRIDCREGLSIVIAGPYRLDAKAKKGRRR